MMSGPAPSEAENSPGVMERCEDFRPHGAHLWKLRSSRDWTVAEVLSGDAADVVFTQVICPGRGGWFGPWKRSNDEGLNDEAN